MDLHGELPTQAALARFIDEGLLARHIRKAGREYAARHAQIASSLQRDFARWLDPVASAAGLHLTARVRHGAGVDLDAVLARARRSGIEVAALSRYYAESAGQPGILIGYGAIATSNVAEGMTRLVTSFR